MNRRVVKNIQSALLSLLLERLLTFFSENTNIELTVVKYDSIGKGTGVK